MIISGGSRSNWRFFARHLMNPDQNEQVSIEEIRGLAADNLLDAFREMDALASGTRCKNHFYHADINPREDEHLTDDQWEKAVDTLEANLGLDGHSRFVVQHEKEGRIHRHVVWSRIDTDTMTAVSDSKNYASHERTARELEQAFGHEPVRGAHGRDGGKRPERRPDNWEVFRGQRSGIDPQDMKAELTELWRQADSGPAFAAALEERGYVLAKGDKRDFVVVDQAGDAHSLARRISGAKAADIRQRLSGVDRESLPTVEEARAVAKEHAASPDQAERPEPLITPTPIPDQSALDRFAGDVTSAMRENGGEPYMRDGMSFWERSVAAIATMRDQFFSWVKEGWQDLVDRFRADRNSGPDDHDFGR